MPRVLVIGASRGIGLEFVRQYRSAGWNVIGTHRDEAGRERIGALGAQALPLEVRDPASIAALDSALCGQALDLALVNAGLYGPREASFARPPADEDFDAVMHTNVLGPMRLAPMLGALLEARGGTLAILSSRMGSIASTTSSQGMLYRASKAALNMVARLVHLELAPRSVRVLAFHPGWVRTDMGGAGADLSVETSVADMRRVIDDATTWPGGSLINHDGAALPW